MRLRARSMRAIAAVEGRAPRRRRRRRPPRAPGRPGSWRRAVGARVDRARPRVGRDRPDRVGLERDVVVGERGRRAAGRAAARIAARAPCASRGRRAPASVGHGPGGLGPACGPPLATQRAAAPAARSVGVAPDRERRRLAAARATRESVWASASSDPDRARAGGDRARVPRRGRVRSTRTGARVDRTSASRRRAAARRRVAAVGGPANATAPAASAAAARRRGERRRRRRGRRRRAGGRRRRRAGAGAGASARRSAWSPRSAGPGSSPSSSASRRRPRRTPRAPRPAGRSDSRASMSCARGRSRSGCRAHQRVELEHQRGVRAAGEVRLDARLLCLQPRLLQRGRAASANGSCSRSASGRPRHRAERVAQLRRRSLAASPAARAARPSAAAARTGAVELVVVELQHVAGRAGDEHGRLAQRLAQARHVRVERGWASGRRALAPERVDQAVAREHLARVEQQHREQRLLPRAAERAAGGPPPSVEGPEDAELEAGSQSATLPARQADVSAPSGRSGPGAARAHPDGRTPDAAHAHREPGGGRRRARPATPAAATHPGANGRLAFQRPAATRSTCSRSGPTARTPRGCCARA